MDKKIIFLVEDDSVISDIIKSAFEREYHVLVSSRCSEAVVLLENPFDIALVDYMLPDGNGFEVLRAIRKVKPAAPVIMLTAYSSEDVVIKAFRSGATDYIKKPLVLAYLRKKVSDILAGKNGEELADGSITANGEDFLLDGIAAFIENNYSADLSREMLAEKICMNKYKFSNVFNERFGQNMKSYINKVRVKKAAELLRNNKGLCIADIAESVGYKNIMHFERVFKEIYGVSPTDYRTNPVEISEQGNILWLCD